MMMMMMMMLMRICYAGLNLEHVGICLVFFLQYVHRFSSPTSHVIVLV
jgi:hypothetical protein